MACKLEGHISFRDVCWGRNKFKLRRGVMKRNANRMGRELLIAALMVVGLAIAGPAYAISFDLNIDHCTGGCGTMPAGTVTLQQTGTTVDVTVHLLQGNLFASTGAVDFQAFKFN